MTNAPAIDSPIMPGFFSDNLASADPAIAAALGREIAREKKQIELIASENVQSPAVLAALSSVLSNKYADKATVIVEINSGLYTSPVSVLSPIKKECVDAETLCNPPGTVVLKYNLEPTTPGIFVTSGEFSITTPFPSRL